MENPPSNNMFVSSRKGTLLFLALDNSSQIAYLENLLKMYNDEIQRLQKSELSLDDLDAEDSFFIQENKLKRKVSPNVINNVDESRGGTIVTGYFTPSFFPSILFQLMKIYEKLCELKGCSTLTGRVIEHRITYSSTRYPEINKRVGALPVMYTDIYVYIYIIKNIVIFIACGCVLFPTIRSSGLLTVLRLRRTLLIT